MAMREIGLIGRRTETRALDDLLADVKSGQSRTLLLRGEAGVGKSALLELVVSHAADCHVLRATGVQAEMELAFAGLHQLLGPVLGRLEHLPAPQRDALGTAFGLRSGPAPDRFFLALATLTLLSEASDDRPLLCLIDDEQWLDRASAQVLAFVARRLGAESVGLIFAGRATSTELSGLPELEVKGLDNNDSRILLDAALTAPLDPRVCDQIVAEARGNPLGLLELPRGVTPAELAGGFALPAAMPLSGRLEESFQRRLEALPPATRQLLLLAATDPVGDPSLLWVAADRLGLSFETAIPAIEAGLIDFGPRVQFRHPLVRSAAYRMATLTEKQEAHRALADATDPRVDPDRRAWHRAQGAPGPDEAVASELETSADRALARGGFAAAAAFLERAATLTPTPAQRAARMLAAAKAKRDAGALDASLGLLVAVDAGPLNARQSAEVQCLRGQIAFDQLRVQDAARLLHAAAQQFEPLSGETARDVRVQALDAAMLLGDLNGPGGIREAATAARVGPPAPQPPRAIDVVLDGLAVRYTDSYAAAVPLLARSIQLLLAVDADAEHLHAWLPISRLKASAALAAEVWDADSWHAVALRETQLARLAGAPVHLQFALNYLAWTYVLRGEFGKAAAMINEDHLIADATGNPPLRFLEMLLAAWRGQQDTAEELIQATLMSASAAGLGRVVDFAVYARAVLNNGLGQLVSAREAAQHLFTSDHVGFGALVIPEVADAASRTNDVSLLSAARDWMAERTPVTPTPWALGLEARIGALLSEGDFADHLHRESLEHLGRTPVGVERARGHLMYGEWLRRQNRRVDARIQLRLADEMFASMGATGFADRARRELRATGETARKRTLEARLDLTPQELQVASLARDGLSNPEIGTRLFISSRTVQYHLRKVFAKLAIRSRAELVHVLPADTAAIESSA
ncbi:hypothetical protein A5624_10495 [Mycobacterium sp. 1482292.6]|nr:hypothetical protein A5624_10495 [Mycobacterium sp. 1482292.6]